MDIAASFFAAYYSLVFWFVCQGKGSRARWNWRGQDLLIVTRRLRGGSLSRAAISRARILTDRPRSFRRGAVDAVGTGLFANGGSMNAIGDWLNESEPVIRNAFRCVVIILLLVVIFRTEESISTADAAHDQAYESREFATIAAHDANNASDNAADAASACKQILYR